MLGQVRQQAGKPRAALPVLGELVRRAEQLRVALDEREPLALEELVRAGLAVALHQLRLVVEQLQLRRAAGHVQVDDLLGLGRKMRRPVRQRIAERVRPTAHAPLARPAASPAPCRPGRHGTAAKSAAA